LEPTVPAFSRLTAEVVVRKINSHVNALIGDSKLLIDGKYVQQQHQNRFGLFDRNELKLGKLLGSGGFSDVYEIRGFNNNNNEGRRCTSKQNRIRQLYEENAIDRNGHPKYVIKQLGVKMMRDPSKFCVAAAELVVEANFLIHLNHKNILSIRGWASNGIESYSSGEHSGYFLILDRLHDTLADRIKRWREDNLERAEKLGRLSIQNNGTSSDELLSRTKVARQIASALKYLHSKNIVFRDLKPNNVGFDVFDNVKIFDFGLAREMPSEYFAAKKRNDDDGVYHMSGKIGTMRFMAPECALSKLYNQKVDTYSWALLFWSCLTLEMPYTNMSRQRHVKKVCLLGQRPELLNDDWPESICYLLKQSWAQNVSKRYTMSKVYTTIARIEKDLVSDTEPEWSWWSMDHPEGRLTAY